MKKLKIMNQKLSVLVYYLFSLSGVFTLGAFTFSTLNNVNEIEPYEWAMAGFFTLFFIIVTIVNRDEFSKL